MDKHLKEYYKQIERALNCPRALRKGFLCDAKRMVEDFLGERPDATLDDIKQFIGKPDELAATFMESLQAEVLEKHLRRKCYIKRAGIVAIAVVLIGAIVLCIYMDNVEKNAVVTKESTIIIWPCPYNGVN